MKTAICLVVKDEEVEITYWLAWHKALGFDSFIIYDDYSSDATEAVIRSLQEVFDIRYYRNAVNRDLHNIRQVRAYNNAVIKYRSEFDWIALFDADEYLELNGATLQEYLADKNEVDCIAFNWCCVGTNGHISRPSGLPVLSYTAHGKEDLFWNRHTKVIFRPEKLTEPVYHVHNVSVRGATIDANGSPVKWTQQHGGFTEQAPDWSKGRLFHYQSRSLEHYINRDRHLEDLRRAKTDPLHDITNREEYNEISTPIAPNYIAEYYRWMLKVREAQGRSIARTLRNTSDTMISSLTSLFLPPNASVFDPTYIPAEHEIAHNWISFHEKPGHILEGLFENGSSYAFFYLKNHLDDFLIQNNERLHAAKTASPEERIVGLYHHGSNHVHLFSPNGKQLTVNRDPRISPVLTYVAWNNSNGTFALSHPRTQRYLSFSPEGEHTVSRIRAFTWESFSAVQLEKSAITPELDRAAHYLALNDSLTAITENCRRSEPGNALIINALSTVEPEELKTAQLLSKNILQEHLI